MRQSTETPLTHRERLTRGLAHTVAGPVDVARGAAGLGGAAVYRGAGELRRRYRESRLPEVLDAAPSPRRLRRSWVIAGAAAAALVAGGVIAMLVRRSGHAEEPSPRPPSVDTHPQL